MRKKLLCAVMCCVLICGTFAPKRAYAVAGVDDVAVVIVCALLAAAGVTFATNDGVQDAVQGFLDASGGKYDSTIERIANGYNVYGSVGAFKIPSMAMGGVRLLLEGLFDYFETDADRKGSVSVSTAGYPPFFASADDSFIIDAFKLSLTHTAPVYVCCYYFGSKNGIGYFLFSLDSFSGSYYDTFYSSSKNIKPLSRVLSYDNQSYNVYYFSMYLSDRMASSSSVFGLSTADLPLLKTTVPESLILDYFFPVSFGEFSLEKSIPYGLTFPDELIAPDVIDNFEQRVEAAAGDLAIVVPVDGVIDNTLPYAEAQEQYLTNVNELGEVTDTVTESNTWLQKILTAVKALPATVIGTGSLDFSGFQNIGLSSVFPFCIPFDLKNALVGFNVTPADPIWEISFDGTFMSAAGSYVLDMTKFEKLFAVVRFFIYGGFVLSLILLTRKIIKG